MQVDPAGTLYERVTPADAAGHRRDRAADGGQVEHVRTGDPHQPFFTKQHADRSRKQRHHRAGADRIVPRRRRLPGAAPRPARDDAGRRDRGSHQERPPRPRRRRLSDRPEMGPGRQATGRAEDIVICNADEGDPGAFMDRRVLESDPHRVLEGMADRRLRRRRRPGLRLRPRRVPAGDPPAADGDPPGPAARHSRRAGLRLRRSISASICASGPGRSSAARRRP